MPSRRKNRFNQAGEKGGSVTRQINYDQGEQFLPNPPTQWVKKRYPLLVSKYEIHKGRHLYISKVAFE